MRKIRAQPTEKFKELASRYLVSRGLFTIEQTQKMDRWHLHKVMAKELKMGDGLLDPSLENRIVERIGLVNPKRRVKAVKNKADGFYRSRKWLALRYDALKKYGPICQCCGSSATKENPIQVDHIKPRSKYPQLALQIENLQILCKDCYMGKRHLDQTDWR